MIALTHLVCCVCVLLAVAGGVQVKIQSNVDTVGLGRSIQLSVSVSEPSVVWPYVNGSQWGSFVTCVGVAPCIILLPLPNAGVATVQAAVLVAGASPPTPGFMVGTALPSSPLAVSNTIAVSVYSRPIVAPQGSSPANLVGMEWEPWFTPHNMHFSLGEGVPLVGWYDSFNADVVKQHAIWFIESGVDFLVVDWTNNAWGLTNFSQRGQYAIELMNGTTFMIETYARLMSEEGWTTPKVVLLLGLDNGPSEPMSVLDQEIDWAISQLALLARMLAHGNPHPSQYFSNAEYPPSMWLELDGAPLMIIFDGGNEHAGMPAPTAPGLTIRWMASQLQNTPTWASSGDMWSWMDGVLQPLTTMYGGAPEAMTVTPAYFAAGGWLGPAARPRLGGSTLLEEIQYAATVKPKFLIVCQWNEFAGTPEGPGNSYADSYNMSLSNDLEPMSLTECGYVRPNDRACGGNGFRDLNSLRAAVQLYRHTLTDSSVTVSWVTTGASASQFGVFVDDALITTVAGVSSYELAVSSLAPGKHYINVTALDASTPYPLSMLEWDDGTQAVHPSAVVDVLKL